MNSNKIISREVVIFDIPPDESILKKYNMEKLLNECKRLNIPREQYEADNDEDKNKRFIISEILRLEPPLPIHQKPILLLSDYDETTMTKINTYKYVKHIIIDNIYKESIITIESYKLPLTKRELDIQNKEFLMNSIYNEINIINIDDYKTKDDILKFACENGKSSGEKYLRASILNKLVIENMTNNKKFIRPRITHYDISVY